MGFFKKVVRFSEKKCCVFLKPLNYKGRKIALETDWDFKNSLKFSDFVFFRKKTWVFQQKNLISSKITKGSNFDAECDWNNEVSENNQSLGFLTNRSVFPNNIMKVFGTAES